MPIINCLICNKEKHYKPYSIKIGGGKYCSRACQWKSLTGKKLSKERIKKMSGINNPNYGKRKEETSQWKGNKVTYRGLHAWITRNLGKPRKCEFCYKETNNSRQFHWANKSGKYKRDFSDWIRLCVSCHFKMDRINIKPKISKICRICKKEFLVYPSRKYTQNYCSDC